MVLVWGLAHQAGFFYEKWSTRPRRIDWTLLWAGLFGLVGLVGSGLYPGSMVGRTGRAVLQHGAAHLVIVALLLFQVGVVELLRPGSMEVLLERPRWPRANE